MLNAQLIVPGDLQATLHFCAEHFITACREAIAEHGSFAVALSGGSTPKSLYALLCQKPYSAEIEWSKIDFFWSDERSVPPSHPENNYRIALQAGLERMPIPTHHIHRMVAETEIEKNALLYEKTLHDVLRDRSLDLVMLGMGEDGHTASLFPNTEGLHLSGRLVIANYIPQKKSWRMTLTYECINDAQQAVFYILGASKKKMLLKVFSSNKIRFPCQQVGTPDHPALWIADQSAAATLTLK